MRKERERKLSLSRLRRAQQPKVRSRKRRALLVERARVARVANGFRSWQQVAVAAGVSHATLSRLQSARGPTYVVRAVTLERLARALRVPAEWLTGDRRDLPYVPEWGLGSQGKGPSRWEKPTADDVRWSWLMKKAEDAIRRDLDEWCGQEGNEAYESWGHALLAILPRLASSMVWRSVMLRPSPRGSGYDLWQTDEAPSDRWLEHILEPWFEGKAYLNARSLSSVLRLLHADPDVQLLSSDHADRETLRGLERYASKSKEREEARLEATWGLEDE